MVANLPYELSEEKVCSSIWYETLCNTDMDIMIAQGDVRSLPTLGRQDRTSSHPAFHGQEAPGAQRAS